MMLKKSFPSLKNILFCALLSTSFGAQAQVSVLPSAYFGASRFMNDIKPIRPSFQTYQTDYGASVSAGFLVEYQPFAFLAIQSGLFFDQLRYYQGYHIESKYEPVPDRTWTEEYWGRTRYFSLPIALKFQWKKLSLSVGVQDSRLQSHSTTYHHYEWSGFDTATVQTSQAFAHRNPGAFFTLGYEFSPNWIASFKYAQGFKGIAVEPDKYWQNLDFVKSVQIIMGLQYRIRLGKKD
ncbi:MAG: hypothetical protein EP332_13165 [Bacteroidetes bacterium]|nr:MAG: hypothetical protein EP332_13165 [Bacteroidota bacterium]